MSHPSVTPFGVTPKGEPVFQIKLDNGIISCDIITFGATVRTLFVPDRAGNMTDVVLGYDTLEQYLTEEGYLGATVGRVANRIAGGTFWLGEEAFSLACNDGRNHLHGGTVGFSHRVWSILQADGESVTLELTSPDGEEGYPGNTKVTAAFLLRGSSLVVCHKAESDKDTLCSLTNHTYFNLSGHGSGNVLNQRLCIFADKYTPSNSEGIPYGTVEPVRGAPMDLRKAVPIGLYIDEDFPQLTQARGYDHNFIVNETPGALMPVAKASSHDTGITMEVETTMPGIHFYTANYIEEGRVGKGGCLYGPRHGFCLETQFYPDAVHHPGFPSPVLKKGQQYCHTTVFTFGR